MRSLVASLVSIALVASPVLAAPDAAPAAAKPWEAGVSEVDRTRADTLFDQANDLVAQGAYQGALDRYQEALAIWHHPAIMFNMAVALVRLGRIVEAADALDQAVKYGAAPFSQEQYGRILDYQHLIGLGVGEIELSCSQEGTKISLDNSTFLSCPGTQKKRVPVGDHVLLGERADLVPETRHILVSGGATAKVDFELQTLERSVAFEYSTRRWIPWSVAGGGVVLSTIGVVLLVSGHSDRSDVVADADRRCAAGCDAAAREQLDTRLDAAKLKGNFGLATLITGGLVLAGGVTWVIVNRPHSKLPRLEVAPTRDGASASASWRF